MDSFGATQEFESRAFGVSRAPVTRHTEATISKETRIEAIALEGLKSERRTSVKAKKQKQKKKEKGFTSHWLIFQKIKVTKVYH